MAPLHAHAMHSGTPLACIGTLTVPGGDPKCMLATGLNAQLHAVPTSNLSPAVVCTLWWHPPPPPPPPTPPPPPPQDYIGETGELALSAVIAGVDTAVNEDGGILAKRERTEQVGLGCAFHHDACLPDWHRHCQCARHIQRHNALHGPMWQIASRL
jgi:hypothetical protein